MNGFVIVHMILCWLGFSLVLVRLRIAAKPHPTLMCKARWWLWVIAHILWVCGFARGLWLGWFNNYEPTSASWLIHTGLVMYLLLKIRHLPEPDK